MSRLQIEEGEPCVPRQLVNGSPVPADRSHTTINPETGMQRGYVVLSEAERARGFIKPLRASYRHKVCGTVTWMDPAIAETYARDPWFYDGTFCVRCREHLALDQFEWLDGEPMDPRLWPAEDLERLAKLAQELP